MTHLTLNTGRRADLPSPEGSSAEMESLLPLVRSGGALPGWLAGFEAEVSHVEGGASFSVWKGPVPVLACGVAWSADGAAPVWRMVEGRYLQLLDRVFDLVVASAAPVMPSELPWIVAVVLPGVGETSEDEVRRLADFEWCFAWILLQTGRGAQDVQSAS